MILVVIQGRNQDFWKGGGGGPITIFTNGGGTGGGLFQAPPAPPPFTFVFISMKINLRNIRID